MTQSRNILDLNKRKQAIEARKAAAPSVRRPMRYASSHLEARHVSHRTRRWKLRALFASLFLLFAAGAAWGISEATYLPRFAITQVRVEGAERLPERLVATYVETLLNDGNRPFISQDTSLTYEPAQIAAAVVGFFPRVRSAKVTHDTYLANTIIVRIEERHAFARWCPALSVVATSTEAVSGTGCYYMDDGGFIYTKDDVPVRLVTQYVFTGGVDSGRAPIGARYAAAHLPGIVAFIHDLEDEGFRPAGADVRGGDDFSVRLDDGFLVHASFGQNARELTKNLQLVLRSDTLAARRDELEYVDLRFGNRVYYRFRGEAPADTVQE